QRSIDVESAPSACASARSTCPTSGSAGERIAVRDLDHSGPLNRLRSEIKYHSASRTANAATVLPARISSGRLRMKLMNATHRIATRFTGELYRPRCQGPRSTTAPRLCARQPRNTGITSDKYTAITLIEVTSE